MANYKESTLTVSPFTRAREIKINHPYNGTPSIEYREERIAELEGQIISKDLGTLVRTVSLDRVIPIRNPETGELTGDEISMVEAYAVIYSAYWQDALQRDYDIANPPQSPIIEDPIIEEQQT